jgi:hypothetical protein
MMKGAEDEQYQIIAKHLLAEMKDMHAYIAVRGSHNICETSDVSAGSMQLAMKKLRGVMDHRVKKTKWCVLRWPTPAMAQPVIAAPAIVRAVGRFLKMKISRGIANSGEVEARALPIATPPERNEKGIDRYLGRICMLHEQTAYERRHSLCGATTDGAGRQWRATRGGLQRGQ